MPFCDNTDHDKLAAQKTVLLLLAVSINVLELCIPRIPFLPWLKPGIANCITIIWIVRFGLTDALLYTILRVWLSSFYVGFSLVTMGLALSGGILSTLAMGLLCVPLRQRTRMVGTIGTAITGAFFHNIGQLIAVYMLLVKNDILFYQVPFMIAASLLFGSLTGFLVPFFWNILSRLFVTTPVVNRILQKKIPNISYMRISGILLLLVSAMTILLIDNMLTLLILAGTVTIAVFFLTGLRFSSLVYPVRFWFLFLIIAFVYLLFSYGTTIPGISMLTYEGLNDTARQSLRLWIWIQTSLLLHHWHVNHAVYHFLNKIFPRHSTSLAAGVFAMDFFPEIIRFAQSRLPREGWSWNSPLLSTTRFVERTSLFILEQLGKEENVSS